MVLIVLTYKKKKKKQTLPTLSFVKVKLLSYCDPLI